MIDWSYDEWPAIDANWHSAGQGHRPDDQIAFHVDLGCGKLKKGRIGIDRHPAEGVNVVADLEEMRTFGIAPHPGADGAMKLRCGGMRLFTGGKGTGERARHFDYPAGGEWMSLVSGNGTTIGLPFPDSSIESMISHHALEHIGEGFIALMDECYRVLKPGAPFRIIVPLFPSTAAVEDPDHCRYFMEGTFEAFCGFPDNCWQESFSVPYTKARFECTDKDHTALLAPEKRWTEEDRRELRVTLRPRK